jgi:hypothetical protein
VLFPFGQALAPRQGPGGKRFENTKSPETVTLSISFLSDRAMIADILPRSFAPADEPRVTVRAASIIGLEWLAGGGYETLGVAVNARYEGEAATTDGEFLLVLWENLADAIITGREELGYSKLFADIKGPSWASASEASFRASWRGFTFVEVTGTDLTDLAPAASQAQAPYLHYKYIPRTGSRGESDAAYPTITPRDNSNVRSVRRITGTGRVDWQVGEWSSLPTLHSIVATLARLPVLSEMNAAINWTIGGDDLSATRRLDQP